MLNKNGIRELAYVSEIKTIDPITGSDHCESATVEGWHVMVRKEQFKVGDKCVYFEIDSKLDTTKEEFAFLDKCHGKIKTQKYTFGGKGLFYSQGLLMRLDEVGLKESDYKVGDFLTDVLEVKYADEEDNKRKANDKKQFNSTFKKLKKYRIIKWLMRYETTRNILLFFFAEKKTTNSAFPTHFPTVHKTDQERCENMTWVLNDKTPYIVTQKCDGSSATYILERKGKKKYEFYVCSRNMRLDNPNAKTYHNEQGEKNVYWDMAIKYDIEKKLTDYLEKHLDDDYICWQGEICSPSIQGNPHHLKEAHLYLFHMIDKNGKWDMRNARKIWEDYGMEYVPIVDEQYVMPDDFEAFKLTADGFYDASVCEGNDNCKREGFVYYKTTDPNFSFKNVSREYLAKKK